MKVELIASTQMHIPFEPDQMPVLAARVSHAQDSKTGKDEEADKKLTKYLADHQHNTPFQHLHATFRLHVPLFVRDQIVRHRTASYSIESFRYTERDYEDFYTPEIFKKNDTRNKQASAGPCEDQEILRDNYVSEVRSSINKYKYLISQGVSREQARFVLPSCMYTNMYMTSDLRNWAHFCGLRCAEDAQEETRTVANTIRIMLADLYPVAWKALQKEL